MKERHQDGTIVATSKTSDSVTKIDKESVDHQQVCKSKKKSGGKSSERRGSAKEGLKLMNGHVNGTLKSTDSGDVLLEDSISKSGDNDSQLLRKQKRKRGKRKKT